MNDGSEHVGVNLLWLVPGVVGGTERSTIELLRAVAEVDDRPSMRLHLAADLLEAHPGLGEMFPVTVAAPSLSARPLRVGVEASWLAWATRGHRLVHHLGGLVPPVRSTPTVVTVHDIQPLDHPDRFGAAKRRWLATMVPRSVDAARLICVPSRFTEDRLVERLGVARDRIRVIPHPIPSAFLGATGADPADVGGRYVLYPAITHAHKGHRRLVDAAALWPADLHLVLPGGAGSEEASVAEAIAASPVRDRIHRLGRISDDELESWYAGAAAVVVPSDYEGFGLPAAEAMRRGVPVAALDGGSSAEVISDGGLVVADPTPAGLAEAVRRLLADRDRWIAAGRRRIRAYLPGVAAEAQLDAYRDALAGPWPDSTTQPAPSPITRLDA